MFAYANKDGFSKFIVLNYSYTVLPNPNTLHKVKMGKKKSLTKARTIWDTYPTYPDYESIMSQFAADYPAICKLVSIATLPSGRKLLLLKITDNVNVKGVADDILECLVSKKCRRGARGKNSKKSAV